jgi:hypothetical protein
VLQSTIDIYLDGLASALRGPERLHADLLAEARDSLLDAAEAHRERGLPADDAERRAIAEFGTYAEVVPGYQAELAVAQGRFTALLLALSLPVLHLAAPLMWWKGPWIATEPPGQRYLTLVAHFDYLLFAATALAVLALLGFRLGGRFVRDGRRYARVIGVGALVFLAVHGATGVVVLGVSLYQWPESMRWPPMIGGSVALAVSFLYAAATAWRCVEAAGEPVTEPRPAPAA